MESLAVSFSARWRLPARARRVWAVRALEQAEGVQVPALWGQPVAVAAPLVLQAAERGLERPQVRAWSAVVLLREVA